MNPMICYLNSRKLCFDQWPGDLRYHPNLYNFTTQQRHPAMVAAIRDVAGKIVAVHQTFLTADGLKIQPSDGIKPRLVVGAMKGGAIRLASTVDRVAICEGVEDALTVTETTDWPCWACVSASNIPELPDTIRKVLLCPDNDAAGQRWLEKAGAAYEAQGRAVQVALPPKHHKDFNAALIAEKEKAAHQGTA